MSEGIHMLHLFLDQLMQSLSAVVFGQVIHDMSLDQLFDVLGGVEFITETSTVCHCLADVGCDDHVIIAGLERGG